MRQVNWAGGACITLAFGRKRQEDFEIEASMNYIARLSQNRTLEVGIEPRPMLC